MSTADHTPGPIHIQTPDLSDFPQQPTFLVAFVAGDEPTQRDEPAERLQQLGAEARSDLLPTEEPESVLWRHVVETEQVRIIELTAMNAAPVQPGTYGDADIEQCKHVITASALLNPYEPASSYAALLHTLTSALPQAIAVLDVDTSMCHPRSYIDAQLEIDDAPPPTDWLWRVDVYTTESHEADPETSTARTWLRTAGLNRCGRRELEMIVPHALANAAARTIDLVADVLIEDADALAPGHAIEIGPGLTLHAQDVESLIDAIPDDTPGSRDCRGQLDIPAVPALLLTAEDAEHADNWPWQCDADLLTAVHSGTHPVYRTERATARQAALARHHWPPFAAAFERAHGSDPALEAHKFLVKAALGDNDPFDESREHVWFEVESIGQAGVRARAVHDAVTPDAMSRNEQCVLDPAGITDWMIATAAGAYGPAHVSMLDELVPAGGANNA